MGRVSFFTMLVDDNMSWIERNAINSAHDSAAAALDATASLAEAQGLAVSRLQQQIVAQNKQIKFLNAAIGVLAAVLRDNNIIDPEILDARLEAAIVNTEEEIAVEAARVPLETCGRCAARIPRTQTTMTETGLICDRCAAGV